MQAFNKEQQHYLKALLSDAMTNASASLSGMLGIEVTHDHLQMFFSQGRTKVYPCYKTDPSVVMLVTPLMGDISGKSFLVFDLNDVELIMTLNPIKASSLSGDILRETLLKEIDNVVSAAFITTVANRLQIPMFGDVPEMHNQSPAIINDVLNQYQPGDINSVVCQSTFLSPKYSQFNPQFIWKFNAPVFQQTIARAVETVGNS